MCQGLSIRIRQMTAHRLHGPVVTWPLGRSCAAQALGSLNWDVTASAWAWVLIWHMVLTFIRYSMRPLEMWIMSASWWSCSYTPGSWALVLWALYWWPSSLSHPSGCASVFHGKWKTSPTHVLVISFMIWTSWYYFLWHF